MKFSIRDLMLLTAVVCLATGWVVEHLSNAKAQATIEARAKAEYDKALKLKDEEHKANDIVNMGELHKFMTEKAKRREAELRKEFEEARVKAGH